MNFRIFLLACTLLILSGCKAFEHPLYNDDIGVVAPIRGTYSFSGDLVDIKESDTVTNGYDLIYRNPEQKKHDSSFRLVLLNNQIFADINNVLGNHSIRRVSIDVDGISIFDENDKSSSYSTYTKLLESGGSSSDIFRISTDDLQKIVRKYVEVFSKLEYRLERL